MKPRKPKPLPELMVIQIVGYRVRTANGYNWTHIGGQYLRDTGAMEQVHHADEFNWGSFKKPKFE